MPHPPAPNQNAQKQDERSVDQSTTLNPPAWKWSLTILKIGVSGFLLVGLLSFVGLAVYLDWQPASASLATPTPELIIVQLNDIYRLDAVRGGKRGGLGRVVTLLRQLKEQKPQVPVIVLHAGDFLAPSLESEVFHGSHMIDAMNFINTVAPLYVVPGNHEFDYSDGEHLTDAIQKSKFPWIVSNIERSDTALLKPLRENVNEHIIQTFGNVKLGIFGLTIDKAHGGKDRSYAPISGDYAQIARREIEYLERQGADLIVGLTHLDISDDHELAKLKQQHPRFMWIAGGHEHSLDREPGWSGAALITKGDSNARTIWKVAVVRNGESFDVREESVPIDESIQSDAAFKHDIEDFYRMKLKNERPYIDSVIADIPSRCYEASEEAVRNKESDWGDYLADAMRKTYRGITVDVAVLNGGSIRIDDSICERITFENLERTFPYPDPVVIVKLKGDALKKYVLEDSLRSKRGDGRFLQVSGVSFRRDLSASADQILKNLQTLSGKGRVAFKDNKIYIVAVNKYIFDCGDKYKFREFVTDYIPGGPDLRSLTYVALSGESKSTGQNSGRIIDAPEYVNLRSTATPKWQILSAADKPCPK